MILSTHIVSDVEYIAKEILIMKNGELLRQGSPETILKSIHSFVWECDVPRQEIERLEKNYIVANLKHSAEAERFKNYIRSIALYNCMECRADIRGFVFILFLRRCLIMNI
mgnify:CR=1 FL=1